MAGGFKKPAKKRGFSWLNKSYKKLGNG